MKARWEVDLEKKPKLKVMREISRGDMSHRCVDAGNERLRRMPTKLRGGTAELKEETGRWSGLPREERTCPVCLVPGIEDVEHFILKCELCKEERKDLFLLLQRLGVEMEQQEDIQIYKKAKSFKKNVIKEHCCKTDKHINKSIKYKMTVLKSDTGTF